MQAREKDNRRDWIIVVLIILIGLLCIMLAGGWALRLTPSWKLDSNMRSNLDPNSDFLTRRPIGLLGPIDSSILTRPAWMDLYLTPGASFATGTPFPTKANNTQPPPPATQTSIPTINVTPTITRTPPISIPPTNTRVSNPAATPTRTLIPSVTPIPAADLQITITDGSTTYIVGGTRTYTIVVYNTIGPSNVIGATVVDNFPAELSGITWICVASGGATCTASGIGNINSSVNLPVGSFVTYTVNANVSPAATGNLVNLATVTVPVGISDPALANNTASDSDTPIFNADLQITKTDGVTSYAPGGSVTYTIVVTNPTGPANATGALVTDYFSAQISGVSWTCTTTGGASCAASGTGNINDTVNIPVGGSLTYTAIANILSTATGNLSNTTTIAAPGGYTDAVPGNNTATDTDTFTASADLQITKTDGVTNYTTTTVLTYTIVASNAGPSNVTGATITDNFPAQVSGVTWTCLAAGGASCAANGTGNINDTVNIPAGGIVTYNAVVLILPSATGDLTNTATVTGPVGFVDPIPANNSATDTDIPYVDLQITKDDGSATFPTSGSVTYTVTVTNNSTFNLTGVTVTDAIPGLVATWGWCVAPCVPVANTSANLSDTINMTANSSISYSILANMQLYMIGTVNNTATVAVPSGYVDANPANNSATDSDTSEPDMGLPNGSLLPIGEGSSVTFFLNQPIVADGLSTADFAYYELGNGTNVFLDQIIIYISADGVTWLPVFYWGDGVPDNNTNVSTFCQPAEDDNCLIPETSLFNNTGITVDVDNSALSFVPPGNYYWIRFTEPALPTSTLDGAHIDSIQVLH